MKKWCLVRFIATFFLFYPGTVFPQQIKEVEARLLKQANENIEKYRKGNAAIQFVDKDGNALKNAKLEITQQTHDFLFGCIIFDLIGNENTYQEERFKRNFKRIFNFAIFPFYWPGYEPIEGRTQWESRLDVVEWCGANGITTKGHPLVWACKSGTPKWLNAFTIPETEALSKARVTNIVKGFSGKIDIWDVVNEPVNVKTWKNKLADMDNENDWEVEDPIPEVADYVEDALHWANDANPAATLIINEFNTIKRLEVRNRFDALLAELEKRKAPIKGIGIQAHEPRQEWYNPEEVWKTFDLYAKYGHPIHITELHPQSGGKDITGWRTGKWTEETQAEFTDQFVRLCFGHPAVASINWWGFSDRNIWQPGGGLVDEEYRPKPVYEMLDKMINEEWKTHMETVLDNQGAATFRGFYGNYEIKLTTADGKVSKHKIHVQKNEQNDWRFTLEQ